MEWENEVNTGEVNKLVAKKREPKLSLFFFESMTTIPS
jgi:hypothetical protein